MKRKLNAMSQQYVTALHKHLKQSPRASLQPARRLGSKALALGLETLDLARMHERALAALETSGSRDALTERGEIFFTEAITPIEKTHQAALKVSARLSELEKTLGQRTLDLAASHQRLKA
ncbi:MAG: hypothetical protein ACYDH9_27745, partial [Limisphaerales bacterium]